jgi:acyl dehydratase
MLQDTAEVVEGFEIPPFSREANLHAFNRYAAVNDEFVDIHMDDEAGRAAGYPGAFGMGNLTFAWMHCLLRDWLGDDGRIVRINCQFRGPALRGDTVTCRGTVTRVYDEDGAQMADLDVWSENQHGEKTTPATATVTFARSGG